MQPLTMARLDRFGEGREGMQIACSYACISLQSCKDCLREKIGMHVLVEFTTPRTGQTRNSEVMPIDRPKSLVMKIHRHEEMLKAR